MTRRARGRDKCLEVELPSGLRARVRGNGKLSKRTLEALDAVATAAVKQLATRKPPGTLKPVPGTCSACGCTDDAACPGGCWWANEEHTLCSACVPDPAARARGVRRAA